MSRRASGAGDSITGSHVDSPMTDDEFRRFAALFPQIVWRTGNHKNVIVSPRWAEVTGKTEAELQDGAWLATVHADDRLGVADALRTARRCESYFETDFRLQFRDGAYHWFRACGEPLRSTSGDVTGWIGFANNIDEQKRAEADLAENETRLQLFLDAARVGTIDHDVEHDLLRCGDLALRVLALPTDAEPTFDHVMGAIHPDDREHFLDAIQVAIASPGTGVIDTTFRSLHTDGTVVWVNTRGQYLFEGVGADRRAVRFVGVAADVTGRVRDLEERARLSAVVASSEDAIIAKTTKGIVTHWNAAAERMFGFRPEEMLGRSIFPLVPKEFVQEERELLEQVQAGTSVKARVCERIHKNGKRVTVSVTLSPIYDDAGRCIGLSSIIRDVTAQRQLQAELTQAQKMEAIGQLAGGVAHDLNNILTAILVGIEFAAQSPGLEPDVRENFEQIRGEGFRAAALIRQLLAVARRQVIHPRPCDLAEIVDDIVPMLGRLLGEDIVLVTDLAAKRGVFVDPVQMGQVLLNLGVNARDAMPTGGRLSIATRDVPSEGRVVLEVADTGCGMAAEVRAHLFEPFFTTKEPGVGTGLGLSTTYGIVVQSQGTITVESELGVGSTFSISLPAIEPPAKFSSQPLAPSDRHGDETILVVEDDRVVRDLVVRGLGSLGYQIVEARNGSDALVVMKHLRGTIDLLLTDVVMPGMSGLDLVALLRESNPSLRALLMSGYSDEAVRSYGAVGSDIALLAKPFELTTLASRVRDVLDKPHPPRRVSSERTVIPNGSGLF